MTKIKIENKLYHLKLYETQKRAVLIYNWFVARLFKQFIKLNEINQELFDENFDKNIDRICKRTNLSIRSR